MKRGPYRIDTAMPDRIDLGGTTYRRLDDDELDLILPILASELHTWYGPHKTRLERLIHRLQDHT